ncbi:MAG TPA: dockerin type I repeat-containing protein, partial [Dehalococcoidia bacterium]|nr:dockerin type I repeat-containing protein [Dehalococcoidia bacterium]
MLLRAPVLLAAVIVLALLAAGPAPGSTRASAQAGKQGDVTCDSAINAVDSLQILRSVAGLSTSAGCLQDAGDVNCDSAINAVDALRILRYVAGLSNTASNGCVRIGDSLVAGPSSIDLIEAAVGAGDIDQETALKYEVFALYADSRLPAQYTGDDRQPVEGLDIMARVLQGYGGFSPDTQAALAPFFKR